MHPSSTPRRNRAKRPHPYDRTPVKIVKGKNVCNVVALARSISCNQPCLSSSNAHTPSKTNLHQIHIEKTQTPTLFCPKVWGGGTGATPRVQPQGVYNCFPNSRGHAKAGGGGGVKVCKSLAPTVKEHRDSVNALSKHRHCPLQALQPRAGDDLPERDLHLATNSKCIAPRLANLALKAWTV